MLFVVIGVVILLVIAGFLVFGKKNGNSGAVSNTAAVGKEQAQIIKDATKKLAKHPDNADALMSLSKVYFTNSLWDKAMPLYTNLVRIAPIHPEINKADVNLKAGICYAKLEKWNEAIQSLIISRNEDAQNFDVNYYLGFVYTKINDYEKALPCLKKALLINPQAENVDFLIGKCLHAKKRFREAIPELKTSLGLQPNNKEAMYLFADSLYEDGHGDKAMKVFEHLRADPNFGPNSCLKVGIFHMNQGNHEAAIKDFTIGLKIANVPKDIALELRYRMALCLFDMQKLGEGLALLQSIQQVEKDYKDVKALVVRYQELSQNSNLQIYLSGSAADFVALVRRMTEAYYKKPAVTKILDVNISSMYTDVFAEVIQRTGDKQNMVFRYFRTSGASGELYIRELLESMHDKMPSMKGICLTAGVFTDSARHFVEGRPIDLVEKDKLKLLLKAAN